MAIIELHRYFSFSIYGKAAPDNSTIVQIRMIPQYYFFLLTLLFAIPAAGTRSLIEWSNIVCGGIF